VRDISLHILDIVNNSLAAGASLVEIAVEEDITADRLLLTIEDNGCGMDEELLKKVTGPFVTSRTTRKVGLGLSLLKAACDRSGGRLEIESEPGKGTTVNACFGYANIDRPPLGRVADTIVGLIISNPEADFVYRHTYNSNEFLVDTRDLKEVLKEVPINSPEVIGWLAGYISDGIDGTVIDNK
jgi:hypothetical protein